MDYNIDESISELVKEFKRIKKMGYVKSVRNGSTGVGATFESLIGKNEDAFCLPDFRGIEIKTRRGYSKSKICLFHCVPTGSGFYETKRLRDTYGYPSKRDKNLKCFYAEINGKKITKVGTKFSYILRINYDERKIYLHILNFYNELIDRETYWSFADIEEKINFKLNYLAVIEAFTNVNDGYECFSYSNMKLYKLKGFDQFLYCLENGYINVLFGVDSYTDAERYGMVDSHGVGFTISKEYLYRLFEEIDLSKY